MVIEYCLVCLPRLTLSEPRQAPSVCMHRVRRESTREENATTRKLFPQKKNEGIHPSGGGAPAI